MSKWVYVGQYGAFWRLTVEQWKTLLQKAAQNGQYDLDECGARFLRNKPRWLMRNDIGGYTRLINGVLYYEPLDWTADDFKAALAEITAMDGDVHKPVRTGHEPIQPPE